MSTNYNIRMRRYNGVDYDVLYPETNNLLPNSTYSQISITLTINGWSNNQQTVTAIGVTTTNAVIVSPAPDSIEEYSKRVVYCSAQSTNSLTFTCKRLPSKELTVNVLLPV